MRETSITHVAAKASVLLCARPLQTWGKLRETMPNHVVMLHWHHQNDTCIKMGSCVGHRNVSLFVGGQSQDSVGRPQLLRRREELKWNWTEVFLLTSLLLYHCAKLAHFHATHWFPHLVIQAELCVYRLENKAKRTSDPRKGSPEFEPTWLSFHCHGMGYQLLDHLLQSVSLEVEQSPFHLCSSWLCRSWE